MICNTVAPESPVEGVITKLAIQKGSGRTCVDPDSVPLSCGRIVTYYLSLGQSFGMRIALRHSLRQHMLGYVSLTLLAARQRFDSRKRGNNSCEETIPARPTLMIAALDTGSVLQQDPR